MHNLQLYLVKIYVQNDIFINRLLFVESLAKMYFSEPINILQYSLRNLFYNFLYYFNNIRNFG